MLLVIVVISLLLCIPGLLFARLAARYDRSKLGYGLLGIVVSIGAMVLFRVAFLLLLSIFYTPGDEISHFWFAGSNDWVKLLTVMIACTVVYKYLEHKWKKEHLPKDEHILDN